MAAPESESLYLLGGRWSPIGWVVQFVEAPLDVVVGELVAWRRSLGHELDVREAEPYPRCLRQLEPLEAQWTRELLVEMPTWTAYLNNDLDGGDPTASSAVIARRLATRWIGATHQPAGPGPHASTQLWMCGPEGTPPLYYIRTVVADCVDGRWSWHESGSVQPFEDPARYATRRVRDRFTRADLVGYLRALGIEVDEPTVFGRGMIVSQRVDWSTRRLMLSQARERHRLKPLHG